LLCALRARNDVVLRSSAQAGHISNIEKPAIFNAAVADLFDGVEQGRA
jgi:hypothetical protein